MSNQPTGYVQEWVDTNLEHDSDAFPDQGVTVADDDSDGLSVPEDTVTVLDIVPHDISDPELESEPINNVNVCFPRDTPVITDQGTIMIQNICNKHTLNGKKVVAVTESIPLDEKIVVIEKDSLFINMPSQQTKISQNHRLLFKGEMVKASELVNQVDGAYYEKYNKEILYNVLLDTHEKMIVNNLICETLDPENMVALLYKNRTKMSNKKYNRLVGKINKTVKDRDIIAFTKIGKKLLAI